MNLISSGVRRIAWSLLAFSLLVAVVIGPPGSRAADARGSVASVREVRSQALDALKSGNFAQLNSLMVRAAEQSSDPGIEQMAAWARQFESQRQEFAAQRRKEYDKEVARVQLLVEKQKASYAIDYASRAYLLAEDKKAFRQESWVQSLLRTAVDLARKYEQDEQWFKAMRIYSDLGVIEPEKPQWKDKLKIATRRIRLLAVYSYDTFRTLQEAETADREEIDRLISPTTAPATRPTTRAEENGNFRTDWREVVRGIRMPMLREALADAVENYYRDVTYRQVAVGGLRGLRVVATTPGLEKTFPGLADAGARRKLTAAIDAHIDRILDARIDVAKRVVDEVLDDLQVVNRDTIALPEEVLVSEFADGAFSELDPFSSVIWPYDLEEFQKTTKGEFSGVGIQIQSDDDGSLRVVSPLEDSPAFRAGIKAGDVISHINGKSAKGITLNQAVKKITGPPGTTVTLTVRAVDGTRRDVALIRQTIKVQSVKGWLHKPGGGWDYFIDNQQKIAYLRMTNFSASTGDELERAMDELARAGARGVIFDLRYNPGGLLSAAIEVADRFIDRGVIVSTRPDRQTPNQRTRTDADPLKDKIKLPMVVLVNQYAASASEIVSGALKDHKRAAIVGERTFGKGSVQMLFPLENKRAYLKLTTSHYYLPSDKCIHREENSTEWGVDPDLKIEMTPEQMRQAIDARAEQDVLRGLNDKPQPATTRKARDPLSADSQLSAALLLLRLQLAGAAAG